MLWIVAAAWAVVLLLILRNAVFVSDDAISNDGHVWYVSDRIWRFHHIPWSMPVIGHGKALAFPYVLGPWLSVALLRPLVGDWIVTLWLVLGTVGLIAANVLGIPRVATGMVGPAAVRGTRPWWWRRSSASSRSSGAPRC